MNGDSDAVAGSTFGVARPAWLGGLDKVRNVVRQEMIARQLDRHLGANLGRVLDVGAGQGTQSIRLARAGHEVLAVEPDPDMRAAFEAALRAERSEVQRRVTVRDGSVGGLAAATGGALYDAVLLLGVLMYLPASEPVVAELAAHVGPGGFLALAARTTTSALWRPAARQDWQAALAAFKELDLAQAEGRDMHYVNEIGTPARADDIGKLTSAAAACGLRLENWYGVRIAVDLEELDPAPPSDPGELAALLDVEERLGATDPYRQLGQLAHLILRRSVTQELWLFLGGVLWVYLSWSRSKIMPFHGPCPGAWRKASRGRPDGHWPVRARPAVSWPTASAA
jgi:S-adenosylmethionine-dependent methyltransferase